MKSVSLCFLALAILTITFLQPSPSLATDGRWIGEAVIERTGTWQCPTKWRIVFVTEGGKVSGNYGRSKLSGTIDLNGKIHARAEVGASVGYEFSLKGQVKGEEASGSWRVGECTGSWSASISTSLQKSVRKEESKIVVYLPDIENRSYKNFYKETEPRYAQDSTPKTTCVRVLQRSHLVHSSTGCMNSRNSLGYSNSRGFFGAAGRALAGADFLGGLLALPRFTGKKSAPKSRSISRCRFRCRFTPLPRPRIAR